MPTPLVKSLAAKSGKTIDQVEQAWFNAKKEVDRNHPNYWAIVATITKKAIGLREEATKRSFKAHIAEQDDMAVAAPATYELACALFWLRDTAHAFHLQTHSYAAHMALGDLYDLINDKTDELIEAIQGYGGLLPLIHPALPGPLATFPQTPTEFVAMAYFWFDEQGRTLLPEASAVHNLYDELLAGLLSAKYKLETLQ